MIERKSKGKKTIITLWCQMLSKVDKTGDKTHELVNGDKTHVAKRDHNSSFIFYLLQLKKCKSF